MKKIFILFLLATPAFCFAQKLKKPTIDKITGDTTYSTNVFKLGQNASFFGADIVTCSLMKTKAGMSLLCSILKTGSKSDVFSIREGDNIVIRMKDGKVVTIPATVGGISKTSFSSYGSVHTSSNEITVAYTLSSDAIKDLSAGPVSVVRFESTIGHIDFDIKDKNSEALKSGLALLN